MFKKNGIETAINLLDDTIRKEIQGIFDLNHKAQNFQKLADEKFEEMSVLFEKLLPCKDRVNGLYNSLGNRNLFNKLEYMSLKRIELNKNKETKTRKENDK